MDVTESKTTVATARDAAHIDCSGWPLRPWPAAGMLRRRAFQSVIRQSVLNHMHAHGREHPGIEVCGVLVGTPCCDEAGPYLHVEAAISGQYATSASANVTFTAETWASIQQVMDEKYPERKIVGWYHTHPGFGIFLSGMDLFIHESFFDLPWQIAFVYDPRSGEEGSFVWSNGAVKREPFVVERDVPAEQTAEKPAESTASCARAWEKYFTAFVVLGALVAVAWSYWKLYPC